MAFCSTCGADAGSNKFCMKCGSAVGIAQPVAVPVQPGTAAATVRPGTPAAATKISPIIWILAGIAGLIILVGIALSLGGLFLAHKIRENPALMTARLLTAGNPDVEVLSADRGRNTVTFRNKKTGETVAMNFDDMKKGRIVFKSKGQETDLQARGDGQNGSLEINSPQGTMKFGAGNAAKIPSWVPVYPGVNPVATFSMQGNDGDGGTFQFKTTDSAKSVMEFYEKGLTGAGFKITANIAGNSAASSGAMLAAEDSAKRTVMVTASTPDDGASVNVVFGSKK